MKLLKLVTTLAQNATRNAERGAHIVLLANTGYTTNAKQ
jgi:hypothetical protein